MSIDTNNWHEEIYDHMGDQPYKCICSECGTHLGFDTTVDNQLDIEVCVNPCDCVKEE